MTDTLVSAETVLAIYKEKLSDATHKIVMLQATILGLEDTVRNLEHSLSEAEKPDTSEK